MASTAQIDANRMNAQASTGPRSDAGKSASARNSTGHGLAGRVLFISGEDPAGFNQLLREMITEHRPHDSTEHLLVYKISEQFWFAQRAAGLLTEALELNRTEDNSRQVSLMLRYQSTAERAFYKALAELRKLQKERGKFADGFVSQNAATASADAAAPQNPPPSEAPDGFISQNAPPLPPENGFVSQNAPITIRREGPKIGRNDLCPCGSGLKYKRCCLA